MTDLVLHGRVSLRIFTVLRKYLFNIFLLNNFQVSSRMYNTQDPAPLCSKGSQFPRENGNWIGWWQSSGVDVEMLFCSTGLKAAEESRQLERVWCPQGWQHGGGLPDLRGQREWPLWARNTKHTQWSPEKERWHTGRSWREGDRAESPLEREVLSAQRNYVGNMFLVRERERSRQRIPPRTKGCIWRRPARTAALRSSCHTWSNAA